MNKVTLYVLSCLLSMGGLALYICWVQRLELAAWGLAILASVLYAAAGTNVALTFNTQWFPPPTNMVFKTVGWLIFGGLVLGFAAGRLLMWFYL